MSLSVTYSASFASVTVDQYLSVWAAGFKTADHNASNTGGFNEGGTDGSQYAIRGTNGSNYAVIAQSDTQTGLHYVWDASLPASSNLNHYLYGELDTVTLGNTLLKDASGNYSVQSLAVSFDGLDLSAAQGAGRAGNDVHNVIYNLMQGKTGALETVLDNLLADYGVSTNSTFAQIDAALAAGPVHAASAEAVGVQALPDDLALAA
ncbi:heme acquisition protein HasA [Pseudomonas soli]|uniref:heme acquisition protein HasA n=1 Tax=Pseudomonas soli TaxID=1306993 RepID=UPI0038231FE7